VAAESGDEHDEIVRMCLGSQGVHIADMGNPGAPMVMPDRAAAVRQDPWPIHAPEAFGSPWRSGWEGLGVPRIRNELVGQSVDSAHVEVACRRAIGRLLDFQI